MKRLGALLMALALAGCTSAEPAATPIPTSSVSVTTEPPVTVTPRPTPTVGGYAARRLTVLEEGEAGTLAIKREPGNRIPPGRMRIEVIRIDADARAPKPRRYLLDQYGFSVALKARVENVSKGTRYFSPTDSGAYWLGENGRRGDVALGPLNEPSPIGLIRPGEIRAGRVTFLVPAEKGTIVLKGRTGSLGLPYGPGDAP